VEPHFEANRANWDERVGVHARSAFYDVEGWLRDAPGPRQRELDALGDVTGMTLLHLQCHFGMDTLRWARAGALVTGVDFSPIAVETAIALAQRAGLSERARFVCANVYDAPEALEGENFDVVYVSLGALCWLPNVAGWSRVVAALLAPGGRLYVHDVHPFTFCFDDDGERLIYGYFEEADHPFVSDEASTYTDGAPLSSTRTYEWNHALGEIIASLLARGLVLDALIEHDWTVYRAFPWLDEMTPGHFVCPSGRPQIPLTFTLLAHASI
jgi:SAM-dependent methyltransferase